MMRGRHSHRDEWMNRNEEFREGGNESCLLEAAGWNRKGGFGWIPGEPGAESRIRGDGSCSSSRGLHSKVRIAERRHWGLSAFSAFPLKQKASSLGRSLHTSLGQQLQALLCGPDTDFDQCHLSVLGAQEQIPGIVPAGQTPSQCIPGLACPASVTAHLEIMMNLLSSNGCSNRWINFPEFLFSSLCSQVSFS